MVQKKSGVYNIVVRSEYSCLIGVVIVYTFESFCHIFTFVLYKIGY